MWRGHVPPPAPLPSKLHLCYEPRSETSHLQSVMDYKFTSL